MIEDSGRKLFDMVIVWKLDRFARNRYDNARYKPTLKKNGVKVVSAAEVISEGRKVLFWNLCLKATQNITLPTCLRKSFAV